VQSAVHDTIAAVWRIESARIVAAVARRVRDLGVAEELAQDALVAALERWPLDGLPERPAAWLMTTALNRALDHLRHRQMASARHEDIAADIEALQAHVVPDFSDGLDRQREQAAINDDLLRLIFTACHPVLGAEARVALTLKLLGGLSTAEIARAHLVTEATVAQRIVRAKRTLADARVPFEVPQGEQLVQRLGSVLEVIYLIFNEGYTATQGSDWMRPALCDEALRLGRMLAELAPHEAEVHGLVALMEIQASRTAARTDAQRPARAAGRPEPRPLGPPAHRPRPDRPHPRPGPGPAPGQLPPAGRNRRLPRPRAPGHPDRLAAHRRALRRTHARGTVTRGRTQPSGGRGHGRRSSRRPGRRRTLAVRQGAQNAAHRFLLRHARKARRCP
jgi:RNA polymerase sigma factor (sigma-70 family)